MRNSIRSRALTAGWLAGAAIVAVPSAAFAQAEGSEGGLAEIVVTAQKREQNVQDTPVSVTAVSGQSLVSAGVTNVQELSRIDSTLQIGRATGTVTTFIRGIGNPVTTAGNEASVPVYIDDVYFVRAAYPYFDLASVERVEVLKGPQGTLFGRNASGGVISVYTKDPDADKAEVDIRAGYSSFQTVDAKLYANMPLAENLAANISLSYHNQHDGWGRNKTLVDPLDTSKGYNPGGAKHWYGRHFGARGKILWEPTDTTSVKLIGYYQKSWSNIGLYARPFPGTVGGTPDPAHNGFGNLPGVFPTPSQELPKLGFYDIAMAVKQFNRARGGGGSIRIDQELSFADAVSITAYRKSKELNRAGGNYSPYLWVTYDLNIIDKQFSQEFQLKSKSDSKVNWIAGLYYLNATGGFAPTTIYGPGVAVQGIETLDLNGKQKVKSYAGFAQVTYPITDSINITGGLRYTIDKVHGEGFTRISFLPVLGLDPLEIPNSPPGGFDKTFKKLTWKVGLDHHFSDDVMAYANYSRGYKAGTHNTLPLDSAALKPEVVDAYEVGFKADLMDRKLRFNVAAFWNDIKAPQVQAQRAGLVFLKNAGAARTKGVEMDMTALLAEGLTFRLAGSYLDAKFTDFPDAPSYCPNPQVDAAACQLLSPNLPVTPGNLNTIVVNAKGNRLPYASKWKFSSSINYEKTVAELGHFAVNLSANWADKFNWDADNLWKEKDHLFLDASVAFTPEQANFMTLRLWGKNLTKVKWNEGYYAQASGSAFSSSPGAPRTIGAEVQLKF